MTIDQSPPRAMDPVTRAVLEERHRVLLAVKGVEPAISRDYEPALVQAILGRVLQVVTGTDVRALTSGEVVAVGRHAAPDDESETATLLLGLPARRPGAPEVMVLPPNTMPAVPATPAPVRVPVTQLASSQKGGPNTSPRRRLFGRG